MSWFNRPALVLGAALALACAAAEAQQASATVTFSKREIEIITTYYREAPAVEHDRGRKLPRGIAKKVARGKPLPPGIAKQTLPADLIARLPPPPAGHERLIVAGKMLLVEIATQAVRDVLTDVLFR